jgi:hypothetical protein
MMKKFLMALVLLCSVVFAQPDDSDFTYWPRSYFASIGFSVIANRGDLFDEKRILKVKEDKNGDRAFVYYPNTKVLVSPDYNIGVNIREFSFAASFQYWSMTGTIGGLPENINEQKMRYWRFGLEATYNFFYPEFFQVGVGLGYSFSNFMTEKSSTGADFYNSELMGSAIALVTTMRYYITEHIALAPSIRIYENWYKAIYAKNIGTVDLDSYLWQTYVAVSINAMVQF